jgi:heterotetrameric sarcosine oxidase beta subunit
MISRYSALALLRRAVTGARWQRAWRAPDPRPTYDVIVIGGGGHGLATAYYLAANHGIRNVAVLERGYLGSGNVGRNTTIVRSNYQIDGNTQFFEHSLKLWEGLSHELNYNVMLSQRGQIVLAHGPSQLDVLARKGNIMRLNGIDAELLDRADVVRMLPFLDYSKESRFPIFGGLIQRRAGTVRHDAVAWGYARAADALGVDIIQNCEVTGIVQEHGRVTGVATTRGFVGTKKLGLAVAGASSLVAAMAGLRLPIESHALQAFVSEALKPLIDNVITFGAGHFYISQSDKGGLVFGGDIDGYNSYAARGNLPTIEDVCEGGMALMPMIGRARLVRHWGGIMDMTMDGSPIIDKTPVENLYLTPGSGYCFAHLIAQDKPHDVAAAYRLDRFAQGKLIDEKGVGAQPNLH